MNNGGFNNNNKNNTNNKALAVFELYKMDERVTITELYDAYLECRKKKRGTIPCAEFELNEAANLHELYLELNSGGYEIGQSDAFCVTRPKDREIFAAAFRDRIVHHLLIRKIGDYFEAFFDDESYNCRKGKGKPLRSQKAASANVCNATWRVLRAAGFAGVLYEHTQAYAMPITGELYTRTVQRRGRGVLGIPSAPNCKPPAGIKLPDKGTARRLEKITS